MANELTLDEATHTYRLGTRVLPSVSEIIAPLFDLGSIPTDVLDRKADLGRKLHYACELDDLGVLDDASVAPEIAGYLAGWRKFMAHRRPTWELIEQMRASAALGYAGTPDRIGFINGRHVVVDIKTVYAVSPAYGVQLAGYALLAPPGRLHVRAEPMDRLLVQLTPAGDYRLSTYSNPDDTRCFLGLLAVNQWKRKNPC